MHPLCKGVFICLLCFFSLSANAAVKASLDRETLMPGETATLRIIGEGIQFESVERFPTIPGINITFAGPFQQTVAINGQVTSTHTLNYTVSAVREGDYTIPSIKAVAGGKAYTTPAVKLTVAKATAEAGAREAFARLVVPKTNVYVGEVFRIDVQLYVTQAEQLQMPVLTSDGFIIHKQAPYSRSTTQRGAFLYNVLTFPSAVSAAKAGDLELGPAELSFNLLIRQQRNVNDPFADFLGPLVARRPMTVKTETINMRVLPLPSTNMPPGFSGAVGNFAINVDASPLTLSAGDPITLKLTVSGRGNFDRIQMPVFNWTGFKFYDAQASLASNDPLGMEGSKTFEQVIIPESPDIKELPAIQFSYFDPVQQTYRTLSRTSLPLKISPGKNPGSPLAAPLPAPSPSPSEDETARDIVHIKSDPGKLVSFATPWVARPWFLVFQAFPLALLLSALAYRMNAERLAKNPGLRRKLETNRYIAGQLPVLEQFALKEQSDEFYALLFRLLQVQLGERLNLPASAITEAVLDTELPRKKASPGLIADLHLLFQECNQARYAPGRKEAYLQALLPRLKKALLELQSLPDQ